MNQRAIGWSLGLILLALPTPLLAQPKKVDLRAGVTGFVESIHVAAGATVKKGDLLIQLDGRPQTAALEIAKARVALADAVLLQAEAEFKRAKLLVASKAISREEVDAITVKVQQARTQREEARAVQAREAAILAMTQIRAPFDGKVDAPLVNVGATVKANETMVITITESQPQKKSDEVRELLKERHALLVKIADMKANQYKTGRESWKSVLTARMAASKAELEICDTPAQRIDVLRKSLEYAKELQKAAVSQYKAGVLSQAEVLEVEALVLEVRIQLAREEAKAK